LKAVKRTQTHNRYNVDVKPAGRKSTYWIGMLPPSNLLLSIEEQTLQGLRVVALLFRVCRPTAKCARAPVSPATVKRAVTPAFHGKKIIFARNSTGGVSSNLRF
jgi:hypothetical protein